MRVLELHCQVSCLNGDFLAFFVGALIFTSSVFVMNTVEGKSFRAGKSVLQKLMVGGVGMDYISNGSFT